MSADRQTARDPSPSSRLGMTRSFPYQLVCSRGDAIYSPRELINLCRTCGAPLLAQYDLSPAPSLRDAIRSRPATMWRYVELLPAEAEEIVSLGEGITPLLPSTELPNVWFKDESKNPTRS